MEKNNIKDIQIELQNNVLAIGYNTKLILNITPADADNINEIIITSSDKTVVTINSENDVIPIQEGKAIITVSVGDFSKQIEVTVLPLIKEFISSVNNVEGIVGKTEKFIIDVLPNETYNNEYYFVSTNSEICDVLQEKNTNKLVFKKQGKCEIHVHAKIGHANHSFLVNVKKNTEVNAKNQNILWIVIILLVIMLIVSYALGR